MDSQNFEFLRSKRPVLADLGAFAERYAHTDPASSLIKQRAFIECVVGTIYEKYRLRPSFRTQTMIRSLDIEDFKGFGRRQHLTFAPLTLLGRNKRQGIAIRRQPFPTSVASVPGQPTKTNRRQKPMLRNTPTTPVDSDSGLSPTGTVCTCVRGQTGLRSAFMSPTMLHYTNKGGFNAIHAQQTWRFKASKPPCENPTGAYFTTLDERTPLLAVKLRIPKEKLAFMLSFVDANDLRPIRGDRGRYIFFSPNDYEVGPERQIEARATIHGTEGGAT